jgi:hypothetical protein
MSRRFYRQFPALRDLVAASLDGGSPDCRARRAARALHRLMFLFFLRKNGRLSGRAAPPPEVPPGALEQITTAFDRFDWRLAEGAAGGALTPRALADTFEQSVDRRQTGTYYTGRDVTAYIARATIIPALLDAVSVRRPDFLPADTVNDLVTRNIDLGRFAAERIARCDDLHVLRAVADSLRNLTVFDPTCGCGEFLVAALRVLEPLYEACQARQRSLSGRAERCPPRELVLRHNLYGLDLMPEAVEIARMRLLLALAAERGPGRPPSLPWDDRLRAGDALAPADPFPEITRRGGFSVVLGNPPYVETGPRRFVGRTASCGNLYAFVVERGLKLLAADGRMGMIVPHSAFCTDRMAPLLSLVTRGATTWVSTYDIRPCKLFAGVDQRLAIFLRHPSSRARTFSTRYRRWQEAERPLLFESLRYLDIGPMRYENSLPKAGDPIETDVWHKIHARPPLRDDLGGGTVVYYHNAPRYWVRAMTFAPYFWNERDGARLSAQVKTLTLPGAADAAAVVALLNSSLFCWWWLLLSDCRHLNRREIDRFPAGVSEMSSARKGALGALCRHLMADYRRHAVRKVCHYRATGKVVYDEFYPGRSKAILDDIDRTLAAHYGFTPNEVDFLINNDVKYRPGGE